MTGRLSVLICINIILLYMLNGILRMIPKTANQQKKTTYSVTSNFYFSI